MCMSFVFSIQESVTIAQILVLKQPENYVHILRFILVSQVTIHEIVFSSSSILLVMSYSQRAHSRSGFWILYTFLELMAIIITKMKLQFTRAGKKGEQEGYDIWSENDWKL